MGILTVAKKNYNESMISLSYLLNKIEDQLARPLTGEEISEVVARYHVRIEANYEIISGPRVCSFEWY